MPTENIFFYTVPQSTVATQEETFTQGLKSLPPA